MKTSKLFLLFGALAVLLSTASCTQITPTEAGFRVSNSGDYRGVDSLPLLTGWNFFFPSQTYIVTIPTTMQHIVWSEDEQEGTNPNEHIKVSCMGGSGFNIDIGLNYRVMPNKASKIYLKYKIEDLNVLSQTYIRNIVRGAMQDISGTMTVDSMLNNLPSYEAAVFKRLSERLAVEGFIVDNFNILSKPRPDDPKLANAINDKIKAVQDAQTERLRQAISTARANQKVQTALGDSADIVIRSNAEAMKIKNLQNQLTPEYIEYCRIMRWNGVNSNTVMGNIPSTFVNVR